MQISTSSKNTSTPSSSIEDEEMTTMVEGKREELVTSTTTAIKTETTETAVAGGAKVSFSVIKKKTTQIVAQNKLVGKHEAHNDEEEGHEESRKRGVLHLEDGVIVDSEPLRKKEKKVFVIPVLRLSNQSQIARLKKLVEEGNATAQDRARLELLLESVGEQIEGDNAHNQTLDGKIQLSSGGTGAPTVVVPDESDPDYESMPVGEFGLAFLRGCGWKDEQSAIGKTNAQAVPLRVSKARPKGLGLGAALPSAPPEPKKKDERQATNGTAKEEGEAASVLGKNSYIKCIGGLHKGAYGQVCSMDEENSSVFAELHWPPGKAGRTVRISQFAVEIVTIREFRAKLKEADRGVPVENGRQKQRSGRV